MFFRLSCSTAMLSKVDDLAQCFGDEVVRTSDSRILVAGSSPGHETACFSEIADRLWQVIYLGMLPPPRSTQPCISLGSLNRVPASAGVKTGKSPLPDGRTW